MKSQYTNSVMQNQISARSSTESIVDTGDTEEMHALAMIKELLKNRIKPDRLSFKQTKVYSAIRLDEKNHRPICRLYLDKAKKYIGVLNKRKVETKYEIANVGDIVKYKNELLATVDGYDK